MPYFTTIVRNILLLLALIVVTCGSAQDRRFIHLTTADGLSQNSVECFAQDSAGFIWIGTQDGLVRYDGYDMVVFRYDPDDSTSLSDNFITSLFVDSEGDLWVGTRNGLNLYNKARNGFVKFFLDAKQLHQTVRNIYEARDSTWFIISSQAHSIHKRSRWEWSNELGQQVEDTRRLSPGVMALHFSSDDRIVELHTDHIAVKSSRSQQHLPIPTSDLRQEISGYSIVQGAQKLWILSHGLFSLDLSAMKLKQHSIPGSDTIRYFNSLSFIEGRLWLSTDVGVFVLSEAQPSQVLEHYVHDPNNPFSLNYDFVHSTFQDREKRIWVGTANKGLGIHDPAWLNLRYITRKSDDTELPHPLVWVSHLAADSSLLVGTADGMAIFPAFKPYAPLGPRLEVPVALKDLTAVRDLAEDQQGVLWIASGRSGLVSFDPETGDRKNWRDIAQEMVSVAIDHQGGVWAASYSGLFYKAPGGLNFERVDQRFGISSYVMSAETYGIEVIVAHSYGILRIKIDSAADFEMQKLHFVAGDKSALPFGICSSALPVDDQLYAGMYDRGVAVADAAMKVIRTLDENDGLAGHVIEALIRDDSDRIWISTNQGLSCYHTATEKVQNFTTASGLRNQEFAMHSAMKDPNGWLYFGTVDGLLYFHPDSILLASPAPLHQVVMTELNVNYKDYRSSNAVFAHRPLQALKTLELAPEDKVLSLRFSALNFSRADELRYSYTMEGFDKEWVTVGPEQRLASYTSLPAGEYTFRVRASFADGTLAAKDLVLSVIVLPAYYETWWFRMLALTLIVSLVVSTVRYLSYRKYQRQLRELETKQRIQQERERISMDLHDNVGSQITYMISSLDNLSYQSNKGGNKQTSEEINDLGDFARGTMQQLREAIWVINKSEVSLEEFRLKLEEYCQKLLKAKGLPDWKVECSGTIEQMLPPGAVLHLFRICQESIHNTVKHAEASQISILIEGSNGTVTLSIIDNGKGFDPTIRKVGHYGLDNMKERANQMQAEIEWTSAPERGTQVTVTLSTLKA